MNKGNCSSLVFIKFGKGRVCVFFVGKWGGKVGGKGGGGGFMYVCIYSCHYVDKNMIRTYEKHL